MPDKSSKNRSNYSILSRVWNIGGGIVFLTLLGWWLDQKFHTGTVYTLIGAGLGLMYCFYEVWRSL
jgi:F0F1-type ATP synthase assembly protein I